MNIPDTRIVLRSLPLAALLASCVMFAPLKGVYAQQATKPAPDASEQGIKLYTQGNDQEAINALKSAVKLRKDDLRAWHYLGLAFSRQGKMSDARKAHEKAAQLGENLLSGLLGSAVDGNFATSLRPYIPLLGEAADSAEKHLALSSKSSKSRMEEWRERAEFLRDYIQLLEVGYSGNQVFKVYKPTEVSIKPRILTRPEPQYTEEARDHQVSGTVVLRVILASDGMVRSIRVVRALPHGLTYAAIKAARSIKFVPAMIDGQPVSQYIQIEYNFNLH